MSENCGYGVHVTLSGSFNLRIAGNGALHAMAATATTVQFGTVNSDDFYAGLAQQWVGVNIAVVTNDHTGFEGNQIVTVIPLLALLFSGNAQPLQKFHNGDQSSLALAIWEPCESGGVSYSSK